MSLDSFDDPVEFVVCGEEDEGEKKEEVEKREETAASELKQENDGNDSFDEDPEIVVGTPTLLLITKNSEPAEEQHQNEVSYDSFDEEPEIVRGAPDLLRHEGPPANYVTSPEAFKLPDDSDDGLLELPPQDDNVVSSDNDEKMDWSAADEKKEKKIDHLLKTLSQPVLSDTFIEKAPLRFLTQPLVQLLAQTQLSTPPDSPVRKTLERSAKEEDEEAIVLGDSPLLNRPKPWTKPATKFAQVIRDVSGVIPPEPKQSDIRFFARNKAGERLAPPDYQKERVAHFDCLAAKEKKRREFREKTKERLKKQLKSDKLSASRVILKKYKLTRSSRVRSKATSNASAAASSSADVVSADDNNCCVETMEQ